MKFDPPITYSSRNKSSKLHKYNFYKTNVSPGINNYCSRYEHRLEVVHVAAWNRRGSEYFAGK